MAQQWAKAFYNSRAWEHCRTAYISSVHGLCERCLERGRYVPGYIVHHKIRLTLSNIDNPAIALNHEHLRYECLECHNIEHGKSKETCREGLYFDEEGQLRQVQTGV
jgi:5-methylcytosine-specific restriction protein A